MKTIKLSTIERVVEVKFREGLRGGAFYTVITDGRTIQIQPRVSGWGLQSAAVFHDGRWDIIVRDVYYSGGWWSDAGPQVSMSSEARPATELFAQLGFEIDVNS